MKTNRTTINHNLQSLVFERDSFTCVLCTRPASDCHHITHKSQGGRDIPENLVSVCRLHHSILHGATIRGVADTLKECEQAILEYVSDYYAEQYYEANYPPPKKPNYIGRFECFIHSLKQGETHVLGEATIIMKLGDNDYLAEYNGVKCHAIFNHFSGHYYVDDVYGIIA